MSQDLGDSRKLRRHESEHVTVTVILYYTVLGGVPSEEDVVRAIDDLEELFDGNKGQGKLGDSKFGFMKTKNTAKPAEAEGESKKQKSEDEEKGCVLQ